MTGETLTIALFALGVIFSVIGVLLRKADNAQEEKIRENADRIKVLFAKHDEDVARLEALKLQIAERHYGKDELDRRFDRVEASMRVGFDSLLSEIKSLSAALMSHIQRDDKK